MASEYVQAKINYQFADCELLRSALKAAHRSDEEGTSDDGNRGLAKIGICAIDMVETHNAVVAESRTERDVNSSDHWYKTKQGRATTCKQLGIASCIVQSTRQQQEEPSTTVLANALSAIIGAMWLDLEQQNESLASTYSTVLRVLRGIEAVIADTVEGALPMTDGETVPVSEGSGGSHSAISGAAANVTTPNHTTDHDINSVDASISQWFSEIQRDTFDSVDAASLALYGMASEFDLVSVNEAQTQMQSTSILNPASVANENTFDNFVLPRLGGVLGHPQNPSYIENRGTSDARPRSANRAGNPPTTVTPEKRKHSHADSQRPHNSSLHHKLFRIELQKLDGIPDSIRADLEILLDHAQIGQLGTDPSQVLQLRFMYLAIGSCQSLIDFKEQLRVARDMPAVSTQPIGPTLSLTERFSEICRLDGEEALCVLLRRYHVVKLCETEQEIFLQNNQMIVETPQTFGTGHRTQIGSPVVLQEAALTDALLFKVRQDLTKGTVEFRNFRRRIKRLQKLAKILRILTDTYGFGILALLPSGPTYSESPLTDNMLLSMTEQGFRGFSDLLYQQQGSLLKPLSQAVEPAVMALVTGKLVSECLFPIESADVRVLEGLPKGSIEALELVARPSS